ncbi:unnamed protein product [Clavelina lepadiformis]|uniref:G-protein coupled receptors family 1 profile domain-containing protein n=1 Tax=Clavelina lepadiformis TaxID=159417 RepID=A0ABP0FXF7_CLALP
MTEATKFINLSSANITATGPYATATGLPSSWLSIFGFMLAIAMAFLGTLGNSVTIAAYKRNRKLQTSYNHLITNLCAVDLVFSALVLPLTAPFHVTKQEIYPHEVCSAIGYLYASVMSSSVLNLVFIAINRYIGIVHSSRYRIAFAKELLKWWIVAVWVSTPVLYSPFLIKNSLLWRKSNLACTITTRLDDESKKIYQVLIDVTLQLVPTVTLVVLYRAILRKVKKCRKTVERYPSPMSHTPSWDETKKISKSLCRTPRRSSPIIIDKNDSLATQKQLSSPTDNKSMTYLQVPSTTSTPVKRVGSVSSLQQNRDLPQRRLLSVTSETEDVAKSVPDLHVDDKGHGLCKEEQNQSRRKSCGDETDLENPHKLPLVTSQRPRRRIVMAMRELQIMSTIDSETNSRTFSSIDQGDESPDLKQALTVYRQENETAAFKEGEESDNPTHKEENNENENAILKPKESSLKEEKLTGTQQHKPHINNSNRRRKMASLQIPVLEEVVEYNCNDIQDKQIMTPFSQTTVKLRPFSTQNHLPRQHAVTKESPEEKKGKELKEKFIDEEVGDDAVQKCTTKFVPNNMEPGRANNKLELASSQTTKCTERSKTSPEKSKSEDDEENDISLQERPQLARRRGKWSLSLQRSSIRQFRWGRAKSEGADPLRMSLKWAWNRRRESPNIKIVVEHATSGDTPNQSFCEDKLEVSNDNLNEINLAVKDVTCQVHRDDNRREDGSCETDDKEPCVAKNCGHWQIIRQMLSIKHSTPGSSSRTNSNRNSDKSSSDRSKPSQKLKSNPISSTSIRSSNGECISLNGNTGTRTRDGAKYVLKLTEVEQETLSKCMLSRSKTKALSSDPVAESSEFIISEERRSSVTSRVYRYSIGSDEGVSALSRQGSFSYISTANEYTRKSNIGRASPREMDKNSTKKLQRKGSVYRNWKRKSLNLPFGFSSTSKDSSRNRTRKKRRAAEKHLAYSGCIICITLAICVLPSLVTDILYNLYAIDVHPDILYTITIVSWLHVVINPLLYGGLNPQYRREFRRMWRDARNCCQLRGCRGIDVNDTSSQMNSTVGWNSRSWYPASWWDGRSSKRPSFAA